ncbi:MAG TPA: hypothetical protein DCS07_05675 [Bdellovibrionales bacterium]|nr:MAG: hypothetical protein A2Z97_16525 [Bdellovibrionales bacterium GWB1_52_6]OFZ02866.1 MAG: hypothetical protein A2X97_04645 [Bdellovibrionales bacterium GWA1_52_35]OFZ38036.1 MAG: hypothetical protein A2070_14010 [Bdellovibrionales bacterium GWC1_52_8]HAR42108.1 hypothetical protein [Bdellovibrionales bacterium]HCM38447.1 hypothetical protein [Bdellovibrionales bacterium]
MKEYPWHLPSASEKHQQWFRNIIDFNELTLMWMDDLQIKPEPHLLSRGHAADEVVRDLNTLQSLSARSFESLLDENSPDELLQRLDHMVWSVQGYILSNLLVRAKNAAEKSSLLVVLEQSSWKNGRALAEKRWAGLPPQDLEKLQSLQGALRDTQVGTEGFLTKRSMASSLDFELKSCPHQILYMEVYPVADLLCRLHTHWIRGFIYALNPHVTIEHKIQQPRCLHSWTYL